MLNIQISICLQRKQTYKSPCQTKETAILMMANSVEATSRSLKDYTETSITALVDKIIGMQVEDGLLQNAPLTFNDITEIKSVFIEKLITMFHSRISYPELIEKKGKEWFKGSFRIKRL